MSTSESGASPSSPRIMRLLNWPLVTSTLCTPYPRYIFVCFVYFYRVHRLPAVFNPCVNFFFDLFVYRTTCSLSHAPTLRRKGLFRLIWPLLYLKPPRLKKIRTEMMPKNQKKTPAQRYRLLLRSLKTLVRTRRGSVSTTSLLRVPLSRE
jgi:hypothetical protein